MEFEELKERAEQARDGFDRKVGTSMAIIAAALAVVAVYGHITTTDELLFQQKASDQWAFYQAKSLRRYESDVARDVAGALPGAGAAEVERKYSGNALRYETEGKEIEDKAREFERESEFSGRRALRLHVGEIFLEIAIVFASLAILTKRGLLWGSSLASGLLGCAVAATVLFIRQ